MAGGAYVPLDPSYPAARGEQIMEDAELKVLLVNDDDAFAEYRNVVKCPMLSVTNILDNALLQEPSAINWTPPAPNTSCYIIYTSGTKGKPKGVVVEHANISSFIQHGALYMFKGLGPGGRFLLSSPMTFDVSYGTQFPTLSMGATLVLAPKCALLDELELLINTMKVC
ncbi:MAG: AMP-binding protein [Gammaproteobacteria bacterium]|nr:AMP-binding protein [Gammaproteobacteria bacterium]